MNERLLSELFGGAQRYKALAALYQSPGREFGLRELAAAAGVDSGNLSRWLRRWHDVGLVVRTDRPLPRFKASADPALAPLVSLFKQGSELVDSLRELVAGFEHLTDAAIFGSFARQDLVAASDIDILLIGQISELKANALLRPLSRRFGRPFNATAFEPEEFKRLAWASDAFVGDILKRPLIDLKGNVRAVADRH